MVFIYTALGIQAQKGSSTLPCGFSARTVHLRCRGDSVPERFIYAAVGIQCQNGSSTLPWGFCFFVSNWIAELIANL